MEAIFWKGYCPKESPGAIQKLQDVISVYANIRGYQPFPDQSLSMQIEIREDRLDALRVMLREHIIMADSIAFESSKERKRTVFLHVTFADSTAERPHLGS